MKQWHYEPIEDLEAKLKERLQDFPREPHIWVYMLRALAALLLRTWLKSTTGCALMAARIYPLADLLFWLPITRVT